MSPRAAPSVAVVGAGPGGLAAVMLLASSGLEVTVYESQPRIGGRTGRLTLGDYHFDRGATFFLMPYVLEEIFAAAGRRLTDYVELTRLDPMYRLVVGQRGQAPLTLDCTQDLEEMSRRIGAIEPGDAAAFLRFMRDNRAKLTAFEPILRSPFTSARDLFSAATLRALPLLKPHRSVHGDLKGYFKHPAVRLALSFQSKYLGMSPFKCPSLFTILPFIEYEYGVWHPRGGCNALMTAMATACTEMGVRLHSATPVERVTFQDRRVIGVQTGGTLRRHDHVVMNADAAWALKALVPEHLRPRSLSNRSLDGKKYSCSTAMLYLGLDRPLETTHHTIYVSEDYQENLADIAAGRPSRDPSVYLHNPSAIDPTLAPRGHSSAYILVPTANTRTGTDWTAAMPKLREQALDRAGALAGFDLRPHIRAELPFTPADWQASNINFGATFNLAHNLTQMLHLRPRHKVPGVEGLWLVGGGTHPGSGLPVIFLSSQITSRLLCEQAGVSYSGDRAPSTSVVEAKPLVDKLFAGRTTAAVS